MNNSSSPIPYSPNVETHSDDEAEVISDLRETMLGLSKTMNEHQGHATRSVHAKSFGLVRGTIEVLPGLPATLAQGLFVTPGTYDLVARFSTPPSGQLDVRCTSRPAWLRYQPSTAL